MQPNEAIRLLIATLMLATGSACLAKTEKAGVIVKPQCDGEDGALSGVVVGNATLPWSANDDDNLARLKAALGGSETAVNVVGDTDTPYRCIGGLIFSLQQLGVKKVAFVTDLIADPDDGA